MRSHSLGSVKKGLSTGAFTLVELLTSIAIIAILAAFLLSSLAAAKSKAKKSTCLNNMHQIGLASEMYCQENQDAIVPIAIVPSSYPSGLLVPYPPYIWWPDTLRPFIHGGGPVLSCPDVPVIQAGIHLTNAFGIAMNYSELGIFSAPKKPAFVKTTMVSKPAETVIFADAAYVKNPQEKNPDLWVANTQRPYSWEGFGVWLFEVPSAPKGEWTRNEVRVINRHQGRANTAFVDGHVTQMKTSALGWNYPKGHAAAMWDR